MHRMKKFLATVSVIALVSGSAVAQVPNGFGDNLLINPWMEIDQVNEGASTTLTASAAGTYTYRKQGDGWAGTAATSASSITTAFQNAAIAPNGSNSDLLVTVGTGSATHADGTILDIEQRIEPWRIAQLGYGTANAKPLYLSFCAKASIAGLYSFALVGGVSARIQDLHTAGSSYFHQYNIPTAGQWSCYQFMIPGDTGGTWLATTNTVDATHGMTLAFILGLNGVTTDKYGVPTATAADGVWQNGNQNVVGVNTTNVAMDKTTGSTFELTGVKLSMNPSPLVHAAEVELLQAQRYFAKNLPAGINGTSGVKPAQNIGAYTDSVCSSMGATTAKTGGVQIKFPTQMRAAPTITTFAPKSASAKFNDFTNADAQLTQSVDPATAASVDHVFIQEVTDAANAAGDVICINYQADARL